MAQLIRQAAGAPDRLTLDDLDDPARQFRWVLDGGLGPLLWHAAKETDSNIPEEWRPLCQAADLTARVRHESLVETALDVILAGEASSVPVILLKGISTSDELYPAAHLRPMGDIDVLVPRDGYARIEATLLAGAYERLDYREIEGSHHGAPLRHVESRTLVELHVELFDEDSPLRLAGRALHADTLASSGVVASQYCGRPVWRLSPEAQLLYIAASWFNDLTHFPPHPSFLASLFDAVYLATRFPELLKDDRLPATVDNSMARGSLFAMLAYLPRFGLPAPSEPRLAALRKGLSIVGPLELRMIHAMLDRYQIGGREWRLYLPLPVPGRYSVRHQLLKKSRFFSRRT